jgi:peroxiredoxin
MHTRLLALCLALSGPALAQPAAPQTAKVGAPAPAFTLKDLDGKVVNLADLKGKTVVLEWFNPDCPYVKSSHTKGSLIDTAKRHTQKGVVWLAINSGAPGKQGTGAERNKQAAKTYAMAHPILLDESGQVGKSYGATNTPHMFIIDKQGTLVYAGAIDNSPDGERQSPAGGKLINYVDAALDDLGAARADQHSTTRAYGCSVKYSS